MDDESSSKIITLQIGHFSNFIGAHWWNNIQNLLVQQCRSDGPSSTIHQDILFRKEHSAESNKIHTPRLLCIDLKGSLKTLNEDGTVHLTDKDAESDIKHSPLDRQNDFLNNVSVYQTESFEKNDFLINTNKDNIEQDSYSNGSQRTFYNLDDIVDVWSDYLGTSYHPQSILLLDRYMHSQDMNNFNMFSQGLSLNTDSKFWDMFEDRVHFFAEECDTLQGFQVLVDLDDGFAALGTRILQSLQDIFGSKTIAVFGNWPGSSVSLVDEKRQLINTALSFGHLTLESTLFTPISLQEKLIDSMHKAVEFPHLNYNASLPYHSSAIIASFLDTISLQYRTGTSLLGEFCNSITKTGHKIATTGLSLPFAAKSKSLFGSLSQVNCLYNDSIMKCLTPSHNNQMKNLYSQQVVLRGFPSNYQSPSNAATKLRTESNIEAFETFMFKNYRKSFTGTTFCEESLVTSQSFPQFFKSEVNRDGFLHGSRYKQESVISLPTLASLYTSSGLFDTLHDLIMVTKKINKNTVYAMENNGTERDDLKENLEVLTNLAQTYDETRSNDLL